MVVQISSLPAIMPFNDYGNWDKYIKALYTVFKRDFIDSKPNVGEVTFRLKYNPAFQDRAYTFYHMTHKGNDENERIPDLRRSERLPWCRYTIEHADAYKLRFWEEERKGHHRVCIWLKAMNDDGIVDTENNYFVILEVRKDYVLPWTAFCANAPHQIRKKEKEYSNWLKSVNGKQYSLENLINEIMCREKQESHGNHTTP